MLLLLGSILLPMVARFIIPDLTLEWQKSQRQIDIKTALVSDISETTAKFILAIQIFELIDPRQKTVNLTRSYEDWVERSQIVSAKLSAYYSDPKVATTWNNYVDFVTDFYGLTDCGSEQRAARLQRIGHYVSARLPRGALAQMNLNALSTCPTPPYPIPRGTPFETSWFALRTEVLGMKTAVLQQVVNEKTRLG